MWHSLLVIRDLVLGVEEFFIADPGWSCAAGHWDTRRMQIVFSAGDDHVAQAVLVEPDDFTALSLGIAQHVPRPQVVAALAKMGPGLDGAEAFVSVAAIKGLAGDRAADAEWLAQLDSMIERARKRGSINEAGDMRGHLVRAGGQ